MILSDYSQTVIKHAIHLEMEAISNALAKKHELSSLSVAKFEHGISVLTSVLCQLENKCIINFSEEQEYHIRYALALRLQALMNGLTADNTTLPPEKFNMFTDEVNTLLNLYRTLL